jgi:hypothetical protein
VGIFEEVVTTDKLGRRAGPRARRTIEEKLRIVQETIAQRDACNSLIQLQSVVRFDGRPSDYEAYVGD